MTMRIPDSFSLSNNSLSFQRGGPEILSVLPALGVIPLLGPGDRIKRGFVVWIAAKSDQ